MQYYWGSVVLEYFDPHNSTINLTLGLSDAGNYGLVWETLDGTSNSLTQVTDLNASGSADVWGQVTYIST